MRTDFFERNLNVLYFRFWHRITFIKKKRKIKKIAGQVTTADDSPSGILTHYFASQIRPPLEFSQIRRCDTARKLYR